MSDAHAVARDQLRAFIERIERLECEKKTIADDIKDVYGEAKGTGFDTKVLRKLISIRKQDRDERMEQEAVLDMYMIALGMIEGDYNDDEPRQSAPVQRQQAMPLRSDAGLNILTKHEDIRTAPVTAEESPRKAAEAGSESDGNAVGRPTSERQPETVGSEDGGVTAGETATISPEEAEEGFPSAEREDRAAANAGGDDVTGNALRVPTSQTGEGAANTALPAKSRLRPNCQRPGETCGGYGDKHCQDCLRSMREKEAA